MADSKLEILLTAKDMTTKTLTAFQRKLSAINRSVFSLSGGLVAVAGVGGFAGLVSSLNRATDAAGDFDETFSKVNTLFGSSETAKLTAWAKAAEQGMGLSEQAALDAVGTMGNMFMQLGAATDQASNLSTGMVQLAGDLASFHNAAGGSAAVLESMQAAFRGEYDSLQRYIPTINAAAVQSQALADTHKRNTKELTALDKALATQTIILRDAGKATGDFARTSGGLANQQRILDAQFANLSKTIGKELLPVKTQLITEINKWIEANEGLIAQKVPEYISRIKTDAERLFDVYKKYDAEIGIAAYGIVGALLFGKAGAAGLVGYKIGDLIDDAMYGVDDNVAHLEKRIGDLKKKIDHFSKANIAPGMVDTLRQELKLAEDSLAIMKKAREEKYITITPGSTPSSTADRAAGAAVAENYAMPGQPYYAGLEQAMLARTQADYLKTTIPEWKKTIMAYDGQQMGSTDVFMGMADANKRAMDMMKDDTVETADVMRDAFTGWASGYASELTDMLWESELTFNAIAESFGRMLTQMVLQQGMSKAVGGLFDFITTNASGGVYSGGISAYSGKVVDRPTVFPFARGIGLMGEDGAEAILPLTRVGGDLGVKAQTMPTSVKVELINKSGQPLETSGANASFDADKMILSVVIDGMSRNRMGMRDMMKGMK